MRRAHIAEMPGLPGDAGEGFLTLLVTFDKAISGRRPTEGAAGAIVRKRGTNEVDVPGGFSQVDGEARLVLTATGIGHILVGKCQAAFSHGVIPDLLLFSLAAPAGDGDDLPPAAHLLDAGGQQPGSLAVQQDLRMAIVHGCKGAILGSLDRVLPVHQHQGSGKDFFPVKRYGPHASTPSSTRRLTRFPNSQPTAFIMPG